MCRGTPMAVLGCTRGSVVLQHSFRLLNELMTSCKPLTGKMAKIILSQIYCAI